MTVPTIDSALCCVWTFSSPSEIRINWRTLLNFDVVQKPFQTAIHSIDTMDTISKLALHASIVCNLDTPGLIWKKDNPDLWCTVIITRVGRMFSSSRDWPRAIQTDSSQIALQYILLATAEYTFTNAVQYTGSKGDQTHCQLLTKAARALRLAQIIKSLPNEDKMPTVAFSGSSAAIGILLDLFLYKVKTKPPATMTEKTYTNLESVLRSVIEQSVSLTENKTTPEKARQWAKHVLLFASQQRAINKAYQLYDIADNPKHTCEKTAQCYNTALILLKWAKSTSLPVFSQLQNKLTFAYKMDLSTEEQNPAYIPPELADIQSYNVLSMPPAQSLLQGVVNKNIDTKYKENGLSAAMNLIYGTEYQKSIFITDCD